MDLIQHGYLCDYEMNIFINIFFDRSENGKVTTYFSHKNDIISVKCEIEFSDKIYENDYE